MCVPGAGNRHFIQHRQPLGDRSDLTARIVLDIFRPPSLLAA
ncbi:hypothetical protein PC116_g2584 [Phytophthora cactorum]|uniref:Uncharacterized protein n=1 Tax=Phytophthora cactorum TaxID=29920 RepID=A0A8T1EAR0_9STRA|nr:hypothetical protein Pcac1_g10675 [Phytophthora cactorum]KAG2933848.1 hypothetical protein PC114_g1224 [Phytophthora cactorum]KAG2950297.1 hypothetical protein PC117_g4561 [Phytophthora cactorum]KAG3034828.1 hypothetical protein PC119_g4760 [Phytophthora cactorum]KAG3187113.1 hypothetical protein C6341_g3447 [Phytophthora cactorum]